jgi:hypothetical protein
MRKFLFGFICFLLLILAGCQSSTPVSVKEPELPKDIRALSIKWQEDRLFYLTDQGVQAFFPSDSTTITLMSGDISQRDISWANFFLSPDKSKYILITIGSFDNTLEVRDATKDASIMLLNTEKYRLGSDGHKPYINEAGWLDNENIFFSTSYRLFSVNISTGEEVQITEEYSPEITGLSHNCEVPYLYWSTKVTQLKDKLYYNSRRNLKFPPSIYAADKSGEQELIKDAEILIPVNETSFVYSRESKDGDFNTFLFDIETKKSVLISDKNLLSDGIFRTNNSKLCFMTGDTTGGIYQGTIFDPVTLQQITYEMYNGPRDFPDEDKDRHQFSHFLGAFERDEEYIFLFSVANLDKSKGEYANKYLAYSTKTQKLTQTGDYGDTWLVYMYLNPSGKYIAVTKHNSPGDDDFPFDIVSTTELLVTAGD